MPNWCAAHDAGHRYATKASQLSPIEYASGGVEIATSGVNAASAHSNRSHLTCTSALLSVKCEVESAKCGASHHFALFTLHFALPLRNSSRLYVRAYGVRVLRKEPALAR